jgi:uncharacterized protein (TIGR02453 family)
MTTFSGFDPAALDFLRGLGEHNDRAWFDAHRADYEERLLLPAREFVVALGERLAAIAPAVHADPRVNGSILRINRDTRFSNDKRPYKTHLDLWLWEGDGPSRACSGFFLRIEADAIGYGAGMHHYEKGMLAAYRAAVDDSRRGTALQRAVKKATVSGALVGREGWKRVPAPYPADHPRAELRATAAWSPARACLCRPSSRRPSSPTGASSGLARFGRCRSGSPRSWPRPAR